MAKKWARFWQRSRRDAELRQELEQYIDQETADRIAAGLSPAEARVAAMRKLGNVTRIRENLYEQNSLMAVETLWQDVGYGWRLLRRNPGFAAVAILSIALGIGANASVFTLLDQVILRSLPVEQPNQLVLLTVGGFQYGPAWGDGNELSYPMYEDLRDNNQVFLGMFARFQNPLVMNVGESAERVRSELVSGTYFPTLGVTPAVGRVFDLSDDTRAGSPFVVLGHRFWQERFRSDPNVVGTQIRVNNQPMTIVGVARAGFYGTNLGSATDVFIPLAMAGSLTPIQEPFTNRRMRWLNVFGRLRPDVTAAQARAGLQPFYASRLHFEVTRDAFAKAAARDKERFVTGTLDVTPAAYGKSRLRRQLEQPLWTLTAIGVGVLIIACANVANLLLARATARRREIAVRLALGATRRRVVRQLLVESVLLGAAGGAAGVVLATWGAQGLLAFFADPDVTLTISAWPDARILAVNVVVSLAIGVLFGLAPAWQSSRPEVARVLKGESSAVLSGGYARLRKGLVVAQVAFSMLLLVAAALFVRSLNNILTIDAGFDIPHLLTFAVSPGSSGYELPQTKAYAKAVLERVRATPGVAGAGFVSNALLTGGSWNDRITIEGRPFDPDRRVLTHNNWITQGYFDAMAIRIIAGRDFDAREERLGASDSLPPPPTVAIANEQFVKQYLDGREPLGLHVGIGGNPGTPTPIEIIGVVSTAKYTTLQSQPQAQLYFPYFQLPSIFGFMMYVRTGPSPESLAPSIREAVREIDRRVPLYDIHTMSEQVERSLVNERLVASLSSVLSVLATVLAMIGLYGVMSYTVARRTREIAIRMAFGAVSSRVAALIARDMLVLVTLGMALAGPAYWWLNRYVKSQLYQVSPTDATSIAAAASLLLFAAVVAVLVPSRRALRVNPMTALREE